MPWSPKWLLDVSGLKFCINFSSLLCVLLVMSISNTEDKIKYSFKNEIFFLLHTHARTHTRARTHTHLVQSFDINTFTVICRD